VFQINRSNRGWKPLISDPLIRAEKVAQESDASAAGADTMTGAIDRNWDLRVTPELGNIRVLPGDSPFI